jgi:flavin reductase (DIM6/NTAB) family NADH-FMN oxidoreductase RutF/DNA-binding transcriptional LysR family regulator
MSAPLIGSSSGQATAATDAVLSLRDQFISAMSRVAQTVNVVTTDGPGGRAGVTVSAMASVSADTALPTLLVCVNKSAAADAAILANGRFVLNILRDDQAHVADVFAGRHRDVMADKFDITGWVAMPSGLPRAETALVAFDCRLSASTLVGTHHVLFGEVEAIHGARLGQPLLYADRAYGSPTRIDFPAPPRSGRVERLSLATFHSFGPMVLPEMLRRLAQDGPVDVSLVEGDQRRIDAALASGAVELALLFDMNLPPEFNAIPLAEFPPYVLLPGDHALAGRPSLSAADLADLPMIQLSTPPSTDYFQRLLRAGGIEPKIAFSTSSFEMVRGMVGQGLGYSILATRPAMDTAYDGSRLAVVPFETTEPPSRIVLAFRRGAVLSPAAERFVFLAQDCFVTDA